jgi:hypothetical protein
LMRSGSGSPAYIIRPCCLSSPTWSPNPKTLIPAYEEDLRTFDDLISWTHTTHTAGSYCPIERFYGTVGEERRI